MESKKMNIPEPIAYFKTQNIRDIFPTGYLKWPVRRDSIEGSKERSGRRGLKCLVNSFILLSMRSLP